MTRALRAGSGSAASQVFRNGARRALAFGNRGDDDPRAKGQIAAGKHIRTRRGQRLRIGLQRAARRHLQIVFRPNPGKVGRLADGQDDRIAIHRLLAAFNKLRVEPAVLIEYTAAADQFDAGNLAILPDNALWAEARVEPDAFLFRLLDLLAGSGLG